MTPELFKRYSEDFKRTFARVESFPDDGYVKFLDDWEFLLKREGLYIDRNFMSKQLAYAPAYLLYERFHKLFAHQV